MTPLSQGSMRMGWAHKPRALSTWPELSNWRLLSGFPGNPPCSTSQGLPCSTQAWAGKGKRRSERRAAPAWPWRVAKTSSSASIHTFVCSQSPLPCTAFPSQPLLLEQQQILVSKQHINCFLARFQMISQNWAAQFEQMESRKEGRPATGARARGDG